MAEREADRAQAIGIIGTGRLGSALAVGLAGCGYSLRLAAEGAGAADLALRLGEAVRLVRREQLVAESVLVFLTVPDTVVETVCASLLWEPGRAVVHTCGSLGLDALAPASARGARVGAFHPLQSFTPDSGTGAFVGIAIGIEADDQLGQQLHAMAHALGSEPFSLRGVSRPAYHAAAVLASNYVIALHVAAARAFELAGLPPEQARRALAPLTRGVADHLTRSDLRGALTGPLARADVETVASHLQALAADPGLADLYRTLGRELLRLPLTISPEARAALVALLQSA